VAARADFAKALGIEPGLAQAEQNLRPLRSEHLSNDGLEPHCSALSRSSNAGLSPLLRLSQSGRQVRRSCDRSPNRAILRGATTPHQNGGAISPELVMLRARWMGVQ
jgi:hypothetical protein